MAVSKIPMSISYIIREQAVSYNGDSVSAKEQWVTPEVVAGYKPIGIVGYNEETTVLIHFFNMRLTEDGQIHVGWHIVDNSAINQNILHVYVLYHKI